MVFENYNNIAPPLFPVIHDSSSVWLRWLPHGYGHYVACIVAYSDCNDVIYEYLNHKVVLQWYHPRTRGLCEEDAMHVDMKMIYNHRY